MHVDKPLIYGPIAFAIVVETLNLTYASGVKKRKGARSEPVHLHQKYAETPGRSSVHR